VRTGVQIPSPPPKEHMNHLEENQTTYFQHLAHAWKVAGILIVHGLLPMLWITKASDILCSSDGGVSDSTGDRKHCGESDDERRLSKQGSNQ